jgi:hypothetical protein
MSPRAAICTVALGDQYTEMAAPVLAALAAAGNQCLTLTDRPQAFANGIVTIPDVDDGTHPWHKKRHALRAGLEIADTAYWLEGDSAVPERAPLVPALPPGLNYRKLRPLRAHLTRLAAAQLPAYEDGCVHLGIDESNARAQLHFVVDWTYAITRAEGVHAFLDCWDKYALRLRDTHQVANDGVALGLCSFAVAFPVRQAFDELAVLTNACPHFNWGAQHKYANY